MMIRYLIQKEFTQIRRNAFLPRLIIIFPIMIMFVMPWVMNMEVTNVVVDVVDLDHSTLSQRLVHDIEHNNYFIFHGLKPTYAEALKDIEHTDRFSRSADYGLSVRIYIFTTDLVLIV